MNAETPAQRRTRLIEEYAGQVFTKTTYSAAQTVKVAELLADAVIAATPQEPQSELQQDIERRRADIKANRIAACDMNWGRPETVPSETEKRLMDLCELAYTSGSMWYEWVKEFESIKNDIGAREI